MNAGRIRDSRTSKPLPRIAARRTPGRLPRTREATIALSPDPLPDWYLDQAGATAKPRARASPECRPWIPALSASAPTGIGVNGGRGRTTTRCHRQGSGAARCAGRTQNARNDGPRAGAAMLLKAGRTNEARIEFQSALRALDAPCRTNSEGPGPPANCDNKSKSQKLAGPLRDGTSHAVRHDPIQSFLLLFPCWWLPAQTAAPKGHRGLHLQLQRRPIPWCLVADRQGPRGLVRFGLTRGLPPISQHSGVLTDHAGAHRWASPGHPVQLRDRAHYQRLVPTLRDNPTPFEPRRRDRPAPPAFGSSGISGTHNTNQFAVRDSFYGYAAGRPPDLWLMLKGQCLQCERSPIQAAVFDPLRVVAPTVPTLAHPRKPRRRYCELTDTVRSVPRRSPCHPGPGGGLPAAPRAYYSFDYANIHFICLDSRIPTAVPGRDGAMAARGPGKHGARMDPLLLPPPPYTKGSRFRFPDGRRGRLIDMRQQNILPILEAGGVDLVLAGHSHDYERSYLLDGSLWIQHQHGARELREPRRTSDDGAYLKPTGRAPHQGAVYVVAGCSGQTRQGQTQSSGDVSIPEISSAHLSLSTFTRAGTQRDLHQQREGVRDYFTIRKR